MQCIFLFLFEPLEFYESGRFIVWLINCLGRENEAAIFKVDKELRWYLYFGIRLARMTCLTTL